MLFLNIRLMFRIMSWAHFLCNFNKFLMQAWINASKSEENRLNKTSAVAAFAARVRLTHRIGSVTVLINPVASDFNCTWFSEYPSPYYHHQLPRLPLSSIAIAHLGGMQIVPSFFQPMVKDYLAAIIWIPDQLFTAYWPSEFLYHRMLYIYTQLFMGIYKQGILSLGILWRI